MQNDIEIEYGLYLDDDDTNGDEDDNNKMLQNDCDNYDEN